ncbi:MAG: hypothetical protein RML34_01575 [Leptospiraceae bacterium]|nr:hypothetical protein [Leptospiraceae bacterium]
MNRLFLVVTLILFLLGACRQADLGHPYEEDLFRVAEGKYIVKIIAKGFIPPDEIVLRLENGEELAINKDGVHFFKTKFHQGESFSLSIARSQLSDRCLPPTLSGSFADRDYELTLDCRFRLTEIIPREGATEVELLPIIHLRFSQQLDPTSLVVQDRNGPCYGSVQLSADGFRNCVGFSLYSLSLDKRSLGLRLSEYLEGKKNYHLRLSPSLRSVRKERLPFFETKFTTTQGFFTRVRGGTIDEIFFLDRHSGLSPVNYSANVKILKMPGDRVFVANVGAVGLHKVRRLAMLLADQSLDPSFHPGEGPNGTVYAMARQKDGKILIAGDFTQYDGVPRHRIARLNPDGSLDTTFDPQGGADGLIRALLIQEDGKILVGGHFSQVNGLPRSRLARFFPDGRVDRDFHVVLGGHPWSLSVQALALDPDGKILIGGNFLSCQGYSHWNLARLYVDGRVDTSFNPPTISGSVYALGVQKDRKILVGGSFTSPQNNLTRLNPDGSLDTGFSLGSGFSAWVELVAIDNDNHILAGGNFTTYNGFWVPYFTRLRADGSLDHAFHTGSGPDGSVYSIHVEPNGSILLSGSFASYNNEPRRHLVRLTPQGNPDPSYPAFVSLTGASGSINSVVVQSDGKILVAGDFTTFHGQSRNRIARLLPNGPLDPSFDPGLGASGAIYDLLVQTDGKILVAGAFTSFGGSPRNRIARLNHNGSLDSSFNPGSGANNTIYALALSPDNKIYIAGNFTTYQGEARNRIARLNSDGSLDTTFNPGSGADYYISRLLLHSGGKILITGRFTTYNGISRNGIAQLNPDGSLDSSFDPLSGLGGHWFSGGKALARDSEGRILVAGCFASYQGHHRKNLVRILPTGSIDHSFEAHPDPTTCVDAVAIQADGKILVAGSFSSFEGIPLRGLVRLNPNGRLDPEFHPGLGLLSMGPGYTLALQPNGQILVGGFLSAYDNFFIGGLVRINP